MKQKMCVLAGIFVVAMFLLTTVPTIAMMPNQQMAQQYGVYYEDESYSFPPELPPGTSSLTCITKRRAIDPWHGIVYDVGFSVWSMRLRDGPAHWLDFTGEISVVWHKGQVAQIISHNKYLPWQDYVFGGFDIYRLEQFLFPQPFYTATLTGVIYKDMGAPEPKSRDFVGLNYYYENGLISDPMAMEIASVAYTMEWT